MSRITDYGFLFQTTFGTSKTNLVNNITVVPNEQQFCTETIKSSRDRH